MAPIPAKIVDKNPLAVEPALTTQPQASAKNPKVGCMAFSHNQTAISPIPWNTGLSAFSQAHTAAVLIASHAVMKKFRNPSRSEEHTSELQSRGHLVCRLLLEKKKASN